MSDRRTTPWVRPFPGNTVYVAAGEYAEIVAPNKDLTFKGANAGIAAGVSPGVRGTESVVKGFRNSGNPGTISYTTTIDGFRIDPQGDTALLSATLQPLVWLRGGTTVVENNVFSVDRSWRTARSPARR